MDEKWKPIDPMKSHFLLYFVLLFFLTDKSGSIKCFIAVFVPNHWAHLILIGRRFGGKISKNITA